MRLLRTGCCTKVLLQVENKVDARTLACSLKLELMVRHLLSLKSAVQVQSRFPPLLIERHD